MPECGDDIGPEDDRQRRTQQRAGQQIARHQLLHAREPFSPICARYETLIGMI